LRETCHRGLSKKPRWHLSLLIAGFIPTLIPPDCTAQPGTPQQVHLQTHTIGSGSNGAPSTFSAGQPSHLSSRAA
jgi:hypothetical protein